MAKATKKKEGELQASELSRPPTPFEEMERWFGDVFPRGWTRPFRGDWPSWEQMASAFEGRMPKVDVIDRDDEVVVRAEVPGVEKERLDVSVSDNAVTIKGETKREHKEEKGDYYRREMSRGAFTRTVSLPANVNADEAKANFKDGVLELSLPKVEKAKRRSIKIT